MAIQHDHYSRRYAGTSSHDIVSAIDAALAVLQDKPAPVPFSIEDKKEALFLLAHLVGDLHQPLHVGAVYLDEDGNLVNPDAGAGVDPATETFGGNLISSGSDNLHHEWDDIPEDLTADEATVEDARAGSVNRRRAQALGGDLGHRDNRCRAQGFCGNDLQRGRTRTLDSAFQRPAS